MGSKFKRARRRPSDDSQPRRREARHHEVGEHLQQVLDQATQLKGLVEQREHLDDWVSLQIAESAAKLDDVFNHLKYDRGSTRSRRPQARRTADEAFDLDPEGPKMTEAFDALERQWERFLSDRGYLGRSMDFKEADLQRHGPQNLKIQIQYGSSKKEGVRIYHHSYWDDLQESTYIHATIENGVGKVLSKDSVYVFDRMTPDEMAEKVYEHEKDVLQDHRIHL